MWLTGKAIAAVDRKLRVQLGLALATMLVYSGRSRVRREIFLNEALTLKECKAMDSGADTMK